MNTETRESRLITTVRSGKLSEKELIILYRNAEAENAVGVMDAVKRRLRADFPRAANRMFGKKEADAWAILEEVFNQLAARHDLTKNTLKNGVKTGGTMLSGERYVDVYISYKNRQDLGVSLVLIQSDVESELIARVDRYKTGDGGFRDQTEFQMHDLPHAVAMYEERLAKLLMAGS